MIVITLLIANPNTANGEDVALRKTSIVSSPSLIVSSMICTTHIAVSSLARNVTVLMGTSARSTKSSPIVAGYDIVPAKNTVIIQNTLLSTKRDHNHYQLLNRAVS